jgi:hypothetical protein
VQASRYYDKSESFSAKLRLDSLAEAMTVRQAAWLTLLVQLVIAGSPAVEDCKISSITFETLFDAI